MVTNIGERLREERERLGLTQPEFGELAGGLTKKTQINYEKGLRAPDSAYLAAIAAAGVDVLYILTGQRNTASQPSKNEYTEEEKALVDNYRNANPTGKKAAREVLFALTQPAEGQRKASGE